MRLLASLENIIREGQRIWEEAEEPSQFIADNYNDYDGVKNNGTTDELHVNKLISGDNLSISKYLHNTGYAGKLKLIYVDPPFFSKAEYKAEVKLNLSGDKSVPVIRQSAYADSWEDGMEEYLTMIAARLFGFRELLSDEGSIWVHLDWHAVHYVKVLMDEIFGQENFVNEVVWHYKSGGSSKRRYARKHDTLLFYGKTKDYYFKPQKEKSYNRGYKPYRFKGVQEYKDDVGWHTLVNMKDVWQIDMVGRTSAERTGYATQKPVALLNRIIESCTEEGDICADFFGGSGTMAASAEGKSRRWLSCDIGKLSSVNSLKRMLELKSSFEFIQAHHDNDSDVGDVDIKVHVENIPATKMKHITLTLAGYTFGENSSIPVAGKDMQYIKDIEGGDWLQLIDYWAVDFDYDSKDFRPSLYKSKQGEYVESTLEKTVSKEGTIAVKVIDIFGNRQFKVL